jgi:hypothetical protein
MKHLTGAVLFMIALASCKKDNVTGIGTTKTETRQLIDFSKVEVEGSTDVTVTTGNSFRVEVTAYSNLLSLLETKVVNGTLKIGYKSGSSVLNDNSRVTITMPLLSKFTTSGNSDIELTNGAADNFEAIVTGASTVKGFGFTAREAHVKIEGSGSVQLSVTDKLQAKIVGSGVVTYQGNPAVLSDITGTGKVQKR